MSQSTMNKRKSVLQALLTCIHLEKGCEIYQFIIIIINTSHTYKVNTYLTRSVV